MPTASKKFLVPPYSSSGYGFAPYTTAQNFIAGTFQNAAGGAVMDVENPRHGRPMGKVVVSGPTEVNAAVQAARAAWPEWRNTPIKERAQFMFRLKQLLERDREELTWLISAENGKTRAEAQADIDKGIECIEFATSLPNLAAGSQIDVSRGIRCEVSFEPLGVVAGITPFNFPIMVPLWTLPIAITAGNTFLLKPSELVPYGAYRLAALLKETGLPDGVVNVVHGAREAVEAITDHPDIEAVAFVGSTRVAKLLYSRGCGIGKRMLCMGSAKNNIIVVPDADPELTATTLVASAYGCAGQRCMAASLMVAVGDVQPIIDIMAALAGKTKLGEDMGAIISRDAVKRIRNYIDDSERRGAKVLVDGRAARVDGCPEGYWVGPTILDRVTPDMPAASEEIFGPVLSVVHVSTLDEALALQNKSRYGNGAAIFTTNGGVARYAVERLQAGMVGVNIGVPVPREPFAFGGWKDSKFGHGDITGMDGFRFFTRPRKVTSRWSVQKDQTWMS
jgi:malonate-semialdehyde dehydrogenase (acetylating)/methylmalonate-semialdehyde dehydrogenase